MATLTSIIYNSWHNWELIA